MKVEEYYTNIYNEDARLGEYCDNRHKVEREIKKLVLKKYIKPGIKVLDIGAGTGLYSAFLAEFGCEVTACDLVPKHVEQMNARFKSLGLIIDTQIADALSLPYEDESFDVVLLAGPLYHLNKKIQLKAVEEAARVCKTDGLVIMDFLSELHGYIQHMLLNKDSLLQTPIGKVNDPVFTYNNVSEIDKFCMDAELWLCDVYGTDGITRFLSKDINELPEEHLDKWIEFLWNKCQEKDHMDYSEHCLAIARKL